MIQVVDPIAKYEQVANILRSRLARKEFDIGEKIPSQRQLAKDLNINLSTVNKAISNLITEGYLFQVYGKGTYVAKPKPEKLKHKQIAFIHEIDPQIIPGHVFYSPLFSLLGREANSHGYDFKIFDSSLERQATRSLINNSNTVLRKIIQEKELSGIILLVGSTEPLSDELKELQIPFVSTSDKNLKINNRVSYDTSRAKAMALEYLCKRKCKKIGVIHPLEGECPSSRDFLNECGISPRKIKKNTNVSMFTDVGDAMNKSDGLIITDDYFALDHSITLSTFKPIKNIVVLANAGMTFPLPFTRVNHDPRKLSEAIWSMLSEQINTRKLNQKSIFIEPEIVIGQSAED